MRKSPRSIIYLVLLLWAVLSSEQTVAKNSRCDIDRMWNVFNKSILAPELGLKLRPDIGFFNHPINADIDNYVNAKISYLNLVFNIKISSMPYENSNIFLFYTKNLKEFMNRNWEYLQPYFYGKNLIDIHKQIVNKNHLNSYIFDENHAIGSVLILQTPISKKIISEFVDMYFMLFLGLKYVNDDASIRYFDSLGYDFDAGFRPIDAFLIETFYGENISWKDPFLKEKFDSLVQKSRWCINPADFR